MFNRKKIKNLTMENQRLRCELHKIMNELKEYVPTTEEVDETKFITNEYKTLFLSFVTTNIDCTHDLIKLRFNKLINEEKIYVKAIISCLDFISTKRNKKLSTEKQLRQYLFTDYGKTIIDDLINEVYTRESDSE